jgi:hypothetical protein
MSKISSVILKSNRLYCVWCTDILNTEIQYNSFHSKRCKVYISWKLRQWYAIFGPDFSVFWLDTCGVKLIVIVLWGFMHSLYFVVFPTEAAVPVPHGQGVVNFCASRTFPVPSAYQPQHTPVLRYVWQRLLLLWLWSCLFIFGWKISGKFI